MPPAESTVAARPLSTLARFRADPIAFLRHIAVQGEPAAEFRIGRRRIALLSDPDLIEEALVTKQAAFRKGPGLLRTRPLLGSGLLTSDGEPHRVRRRHLQPAFHGHQIAGYVPAMTRRTDEATQEWRAGEVRDIHREMTRLTLAVVASTLFAGAQAADPNTIMAGVTEALQALYRPLSSCPHVRANTGHAVSALSEVADTLLAGGSSNPKGRDLLALLLGAKLTPTERRDEAMTFLLAGHESVANALTWAWYALSQNDNVRQRFQDEIDSADSLSGFPDALPYTRQVLAEAMRLYPPAWMVSREATADVEIGGHCLAAGTVVIAAPCVTQVDPRFWPDPDRFDPDRWSEEALAQNPRPRFAYFPFGGGARRCIGERFALTEMAIVLSAIGRRWRFDPPPGAAAPRWEPLVTLRPAGGLPMLLTARL